MFSAKNPSVTVKNIMKNSSGIHSTSSYALRDADVCVLPCSQFEVVSLVFRVELSQ